MTFLIEVVVDGGMEGGEFLKAPHPPEAEHRPFSSSKRLMRVFRPVVQPPAGLLQVGAANVPQGCTVRPEPISDDRLRPSDLAFHSVSVNDSTISLPKRRPIKSNGLRETSPIA